MSTRTTCIHSWMATLVVCQSYLLDRYIDYSSIEMEAECGGFYYMASILYFDVFTHL